MSLGSSSSAGAVFFRPGHRPCCNRTALPRVRRERRRAHRPAPWRRPRQRPDLIAALGEDALPHVGEAIGLFAFKLFGEEPGRRVGIAIAGPDQRLDAVEARVVVLTVAYGGGKPLDAGVDLVDTAAHVGVGGQVFGNVDARGPLLAADLLERALQALRTIARRGEVLQADLVGFGFIHAAVVEHGGLPRRPRCPRRWPRCLARRPGGRPPARRRGCRW